ncbi:response regulator receiver [Pseudomonas sp. MT-1]|nr:response regulator receiver [Pseudomonas sp. MT-1]
MILMLVEDMLAELGCTSITSAATVEQALALIDEKDFDAATLDVNLHGIKSFPIADALIARCVPFMFATGFGAEGTAEQQPLVRANDEAVPAIYSMKRRGVMFGSANKATGVR